MFFVGVKNVRASWKGQKKADALPDVATGVQN